MKNNSRIYVAGHNGMVGGALVRALAKLGHSHIITRSHKELDLTNQQAVHDFFASEKPEFVFLAAAKVGGILGNNTYPADFIYDNLVIATNIIHAAHINKANKLLFLGSSCIYPKFAPQPMKEEYLLTGELEPTNEPYAIAKIAGIKLCQAYKKQHGDNFVSVMPTNLYGPGDNYHPQNSHVLPALLQRFHEAKLAKSPSVTIWGTGEPKREFLHVDDLASACVHIMNTYDDAMHVNIGTGVDVSIKEVAQTIKEIVGYEGEIIFDISKPDGAPRKLLDVSKINTLGWKATTTLQDGIKKTYEDFLKEKSEGTIRGIN
jgi:GDP-L-fucose synthase